MPIRVELYPYLGTHEDRVEAYLATIARLMVAIAAANGIKVEIVDGPDAD